MKLVFNILNVVNCSHHSSYWTDVVIYHNRTGWKGKRRILSV